MPASPTFLQLAILLFLTTTPPLVSADYAANSDTNTLNHARSPGIEIMVGGGKLLLEEFEGDMFDNVHYNAEAHQHPWLATTISMIILLLLIFGIIYVAGNAGAEDDVAGRRLRAELKIN
mmetsp:Transcript_3097/g.5811  ORF Transcript_3097/g.5811 Transcript_3097/m.5811 type:complete len:120 (+) Transcript_3097:134-493(+)